MNREVVIHLVKSAFLVCYIVVNGNHWSVNETKYHFAIYTVRKPRLLLLYYYICGHLSCISVTIIQELLPNKSIEELLFGHELGVALTHDFGMYMYVQYRSPPVMSSSHAVHKVIDNTISSQKYAPPFCTLPLDKSGEGASVRIFSSSCAYTPPSVPRSLESA